MLFTLLTFPLCCTLDIEQCERGRLLVGPFANEAIKSILPWLSKRARASEASHLLSQQTPSTLVASQSEYIAGSSLL